MDKVRRMVEELRSTYGLTYHSIAEAIGIPVRTFDAYLKGRTRCFRVTMIKIRLKKLKEKYDREGIST